jgi:hypothetical protein
VPGAGWPVVIGELALDAARRRGRLPVVIGERALDWRGARRGWPGAAALVRTDPCVLAKTDPRIDSGSRSRSPKSNR